MNECAIRIDKFEKDCDIFTMIASVLAILFLCYIKEGVEASNLTESSNTAVQTESLTSGLWNCSSCRKHLMSISVKFPGNRLQVFRF